MKAKIAKKTTKKTANKSKKHYDFDDVLFKKYPKLFQTDENGKLLPQFQRCWNDCPKGWEQLVDDLCFAINNYVYNTSRHIKDPSKKHIYFLIDVCRKINQIFSNIKFNIGKKIIKNAICFLNAKAPFIQKTPPLVKIGQYKEKFGTLRFYIDGGDDEVEGMIRFAEYLSSVTCQNTGNRGKMRKVKGWCITLSDKEFKKINEKINKPQ
jgi:hypothetical protein